MCSILAFGLSKSSVWYGFFKFEIELCRFLAVLMGMTVTAWLRLRQWSARTLAFKLNFILWSPTLIILTHGMNGNTDVEPSLWYGSFHKRLITATFLCSALIHFHVYSPNCTNVRPIRLKPTKCLWGRTSKLRHTQWRIVESRLWRRQHPKFQWASFTFGDFEAVMNILRILLNSVVIAPSAWVVLCLQRSRQRKPLVYDRRTVFELIECSVTVQY